MKTTLAISMALALAAAMPEASAQDPDAAAERARLANQRILAESEQRRRDASDAAASQAPAAATPAEPAAEPATTLVAPLPAAAATEAPDVDRLSPEEISAVGPASGNGDDIAVVLEQLKALGELKEAGHVSDDEFDRIKQRILDENR